MYGAKDWLKNFSHWEIECKLFKDEIHMQISSSLQQLIAEEQRMLKRKFLLITRNIFSIRSLFLKLLIYHIKQMLLTYKKIIFERINLD